jgi:hypothetical protein
MCSKNRVGLRDAFRRVVAAGSACGRGEPKHHDALAEACQVRAQQWIDRADGDEDLRLHSSLPNSNGNKNPTGGPVGRVVEPQLTLRGRTNPDGPPGLVLDDYCRSRKRNSRICLLSRKLSKLILGFAFDEVNKEQGHENEVLMVELRSGSVALVDVNLATVLPTQRVGIQQDSVPWGCSR